MTWLHTLNALGIMMPGVVATPSESRSYPESPRLGLGRLWSAPSSSPVSVALDCGSERCTDLDSRSVCAACHVRSRRFTPRNKLHAVLQLSGFEETLRLLYVVAVSVNILFSFFTFVFGI